MHSSRWEFSRAKELNRWELGSSSTSDEAGESSEDQQQGQRAPPQMFNPPFVRHLALADVATGTDRTWGRLAVAAVGDGSVALFDVEQEAATSGSKGSAKGASKAAARNADMATCPPLPTLVPGLKMSLDHTAGGHTAAVSCCCFINGSLEADMSADQERGDSWKEEMLLASAGDDRRVLIWSVPRAVAFSWHRKQQHQSEKQLSALSTEYGAQETCLSSRFLRSDPGSSPLVAQMEHRRKVNSLCTSSDLGGNAVLYVADTGRMITCIRC